jgi:hypothetical protein
MPAALYPRNKKMRLARRQRVTGAREEIADPLLCIKCEGLFNRQGESEALRWLAPKAKKVRPPLWQALDRTTPAVEGPDFKMYFASSLGLSAERIAYFVLSLVWRAAAHEWPLFGGTTSRRLELGEWYEPIRTYLLGETGFPPHTYLTMAVCTDQRSQEYWMPPQLSDELPPMIVVPILGALFRVWPGRVIPRPLERQIFYPGDANVVFTTHCWDVLGGTFESLLGEHDGTSD